MRLSSSGVLYLSPLGVGKSNSRFTAPGFDRLMAKCRVGFQALIALTALGLASSARALPPFTDANWITRWEATAGFNGPVNAFAFSPASGAVYAGGQFTFVDQIVATNVAMWNGSNWSSLGLVVVGNGVVNALAVDGQGNLYVGGGFTNLNGIAINGIAKWDGKQWSALGSGVNSNVLSLAFDASGYLYAGGMFTFAGPIPANHVARWDGANWTGLGSGCEGNVQALAADSSGNIYAGGAFLYSGNVEANLIARWDGTNWWPLGPGLGDNQNLSVMSLALDPAGNLYAGGSFTNGGGVSATVIAKWNGTAWSALGPGLSSWVQALAINSAGNPVAGGLFSSTGGTPVTNVVQWDGTAWHTVGAGLNGTVKALAVDASGAVYAGGTFSASGTNTLADVATYRSGAWSPMVSGKLGLNSVVYAIGTDGSGKVYLGGAFGSAGGKNASRVAAWDGANWSSFGVELGGTGSYYEYTPPNGAIASGRDGSIYVLGSFFGTASNTNASGWAKWNGSNWVAFGPLLSGGTRYPLFPYSTLNAAYSLTADPGGSLYVGGNFGAVGGVLAQSVAKWDGTNWSGLGSGCEGFVFALTSDNAGNLYSAGSFTYAGNAVAKGIARWDGTNWYALGGGITFNSNNYTAIPVGALAVASNGVLYAGGTFTNAGGVTVTNIARWNGANWSALGSGLNGAVYSLAVDAAGILYAGGAFTASGTNTLRYLARWDGTNWSVLGSGVNGIVHSLKYDNNGHLLVGGEFTTAGPNASPYFAEAIVGTATNPPLLAILNNASGGVTVSWPLDHVGWRLLGQRNFPGVGVTSNWFTIAGSTNVNTVTLPIQPGVGSAFYRLVYP